MNRILSTKGGKSNDETFLSDSKLTARDKALVAFGAAAAGRCQY